MNENSFLALGLKVAGYKVPNRCQEATNIHRFQSHFGAAPATCVKIWNDLKTTSNVQGQISPSRKPIFLLIGLRFLWRYETEEVLAKFFDMCVRKIRPLYRESAEKIHLLLDTMLTPIEDTEDEAIFILSLDGTHCPIEEPRPWSSKWSSHKLGNKAGLAYEVGLRISSPELVWVHGPFPPGEYNDLQIFRDKLKGKLQTLNSQLTVEKKVRT